MTLHSAREFILAERPKGLPTEKTFALKTVKIPEPRSGEVLLRSVYISVDPYLRGRMQDAKSYIPPFAIGEPIVSGMVAQVVSSQNPAYSKGDYIEGLLPWRELNLSDGKGLRKLDKTHAPLSTALGLFGMPGLTAYFGLLDLGQPREGETVVVSGAAGAVGSAVGQIAKLKGARVVGIAGSQEKLDYLTKELKFDAAVSYKSPKFSEDLQKACGNGVDVYFDNVGGSSTDEVMNLLNFKARIAICGQISMYNAEQPDVGIRPFTKFVTKSVRAEGFIVSNFANRFGEGIGQLLKWYSEGKLSFKESRVEGFENLPKAFIGLFKGENLGKQIVQVSKE